MGTDIIRFESKESLYEGINQLVLEVKTVNEIYFIHCTQ